MGTLRSIGHQIAVSMRKLLKSPRSVSKLVALNSGSTSAGSSELNTPDSMRSVSFTEAMSWPYIDDEISDDIVS